jgi:hypothetical protein
MGRKAILSQALSDLRFDFVTAKFGHAKRVVKAFRLPGVLRIHFLAMHPYGNMRIKSNR